MTMKGPEFERLILEIGISKGELAERWEIPLKEVQSLCESDDVSGLYVDAIFYLDEYWTPDK